jgi:translation initiation factor IF-2
MKVVAPGYGSVISGAIAFAGTMAIGAGARQYFLRGGTIEEAKAAFSKAKDSAEEDGKKEEEARRSQDAEVRRRSEQEAARRLAGGQPAPPPPPGTRKSVQPLAGASANEPAASATTAAAPGVRRVNETEEEKRVIRRPGLPTKVILPPAKPARGAEVKNRGRLTVTNAVAEEEERTRSVASFRRRMQRLTGRGQQPKEKLLREVILPETITIQELANRMAARGGEVVKSLFRMGVMATLTQSIDADTAELVVQEFGHRVKRVADSDVEIGLEGEADEDTDPLLVMARTRMVFVPASSASPSGNASGLGRDQLVPSKTM